MAAAERMKELYACVRRIPKGRVASYGLMGAVLSAGKVSGLVAGGWLNKLTPELAEEVPWWRVVGADGSLLTARRSPMLAREQQSRLLDEGVEFEEDRVAPACFLSREEWECLPPSPPE